MLGIAARPEEQPDYLYRENAVSSGQVFSEVKSVGALHSAAISS
jgi:hypothetical protein